MRAHAQKAQREKARIWGRAKRRTSDNKKARPLGVLAQENIGFGLTILPPSAFKKPGNPNNGLPGFFCFVSGRARYTIAPAMLKANTNKSTYISTASAQPMAFTTR